MNAAKIGAAIKTLRLKTGYTQHELADCLNVTDKAVSKWERGISVPDISIVMKLANLLNCDVDNLLEGNITYLERTWQGLLILREENGIFAGSDVYGKPLVDLMIGYFMLAGIGNIWIRCPDQTRKYIERRMGDGTAYGIGLYYLPEQEELPPVRGNTMLIYGNPFVYGPYLTRCCQRAFSRHDGISVLTVEKGAEAGDTVVSFDNNKAIQCDGNGEMRQVAVPVFFFPVAWFDQIRKADRIGELSPLYAEPLDNGIIEYAIDSEDALLDTSFLIRFLERRMGKRIYDIQEIAQKRGFLQDRGVFV